MERVAAVAPREGHHDLADRLGAARPDLPEPHLAAGRERDPDPQDELVRGEGRLPVARPEVAGRHRRARRGRAEDERRVHREQDRQRVAGRRGVGDVAAERPAVLDLGGADRRGRLDQRRGDARGRAPSGGSRCRSSARRGRPRRRRWRSRAGRRDPTGRRSASGGSPSSPVSATIRSVPPAIGRAAVERARYASARSRGLTTGGSIGIAAPSRLPPTAPACRARAGRSRRSCRTRQRAGPG